MTSQAEDQVTDVSKQDDDQGSQQPSQPAGQLDDQAHQPDDQAHQPDDQASQQTIAATQDSFVSQEYGLLMSQQLSPCELPSAMICGARQDEKQLETTAQQSEDPDEQPTQEPAGWAVSARDDNGGREDDKRSPAGVATTSASVTPHYEDVSPLDVAAAHIEPLLPRHLVHPRIQREDKPDFFRQVKVTTVVPVLLSNEAAEIQPEQQQGEENQKQSLSLSSSSSYYTVRCWWANPAHRGLPRHAPGDRAWTDELGDVHTTRPIGWFVKSVSDHVSTHNDDSSSPTTTSHSRATNGVTTTTDTSTTRCKKRQREQHSDEDDGEQQPEAKEGGGGPEDDANEKRQCDPDDEKRQSDPDDVASTLLPARVTKRHRPDHHHHDSSDVQPSEAPADDTTAEPQTLADPDATQTQYES